MPAAAAAVGIDVDLDSPPTHLADVPRLLTLWIAIGDADLLDSSTTQVFPAVDADVLASDQPLTAEHRAIVVETALRGTIDDACLDIDAEDDAPSPMAIAVLPVLSMTATGHDVPSDVLANADGIASTGALVQELLDLGVLIAGSQPGSVTVRPGLEQMLAGITLDLLDDVTGDDHWEDDDEV
ncbi:hypothetical protein SAMN06264364_1042 [Quadrisphaera granulorum]|uniref:Uncharacterized protein n=1 Tax=Quadrisphaera granulorum TaxID=317664 RepID=A0A316ABT5_9ACTN|nr:hypothetical protein [Quadrisphaera granulorum]PWJ55081.1 hypothetical protein BXY45_1042 [Quadrisphaera granulorum]SZE95590.1 hypothetical protein SAMN06264364_1042 [Quadrisphaera granulorum]